MTLTPRTQRRAALAAVTAAVSLALTGCGAGFDAQTTMPYQAAEGTNASSGSVAVRNMLVLASEDGKGRLNGAIVNTGEETDTLTGVSAAAPDAPASNGTDPTGSPTPVSVAGVKTVELQPGTSLLLPQQGAAPVTVTGAKPGQVVKLTFTFGTAAPLTISVPILTLDHYSPTPRPATDGEG